MYQDFAEIYDALMNDVDYESWAEHYTRLLSIFGIRGGKVCECACGTGGLTLPLRRRGFQMTGVDLSREMLWQAAQKARKNGMNIPFVQQDMRSLNLHKPVDAVIATCDGVNYLMTEEDLLSFFRAAKRAIRPGGRAGLRRFHTAQAEEYPGRGTDVRGPAGYHLSVAEYLA